MTKEGFKPLNVDIPEALAAAFTRYAQRAGMRNPKKHLAAIAIHHMVTTADTVTLAKWAAIYDRWVESGFPEIELPQPPDPVPDHGGSGTTGGHSGSRTTTRRSRAIG